MKRVSPFLSRVCSALPIFAGIFFGLVFSLSMMWPGYGIDRISDVAFTSVSYGERLAQLEADILRDPADPNGYSNRAKTYLVLLDYPRAVDDFSRTIFLVPDLPLPYFQRGLVYLQLQQWQSAAEDFSASILRQNPDPQVFLARARAFEMLGRWSEAADDMEAYLRLQPDDSNRAKIEERLERARRLSHE